MDIGGYPCAKLALEASAWTACKPKLRLQACASECNGIVDPGLCHANHYKPWPCWAVRFWCCCAPWLPDTCYCGCNKANCSIWPVIVPVITWLRGWKRGGVELFTGNLGGWSLLLCLVWRFSSLTKPVAYSCCKRCMVTHGQDMLCWVCFCFSMLSLDISSSSGEALRL